MAFTRGLRRLPALSWLKISAERANKTQGQELYGRTSRAVEAFGTNVAFRGLAFNPYLTLSLRPSPALPPSQPYTPCPAVQTGWGGGEGGGQTELET